MMRGIGVSLAAVVLSGVASGQKATEIYIPVGESPGLSDEYTVIGTVRGVDPEASTFTVVDSEREWPVEVTERTKIWLDKSPLRRSNEVGSFDDLRAEDRVEVLFEDHDSRDGGPAEWIKIEVKEER